MDIPALFDKKKDDQSSDSAAKPAVVLGDPLASMPADDSASAADSTSDDSATTDDKALDATDDPTHVFLDNGHIVPNKTVSTNDSSAVGEFKKTEPSDVPSFAASAPEPDAQPDVPQIPEPTPEPTIDDAPSLTVPLPPDPEDPEKTAFIKTYTQEFDDTLHRATTAAQKVLDAIDTAIREHSSDIVVPEEANEFLDEQPDDGKVQKFEDARSVVRTIMTRATEAKEQSAQAAAEAAKVYDEVQAFKKETKEQITQLVGDDKDN